jgi:hypothetical protein
LIVLSPTLEEAIDAVRSSLAGEPSAPSQDPEAFDKGHAVSVIAQLERQARANAGIAERSALQSAQLSVLAGIADALTRNEDIEAALADVLAACLDAGGISRGALFRIDAREHLTLSIATGFPPGSQVDQLFGFRTLFDQGARGSIVAAHTALPPDDARSFLERVNASAAVIVPVMDGPDRIGALLLGTDLPDLGEHDLAMFGRAIAAHISQALALTDSFRRLRTSAEASRILSASLDVSATQHALGGLATIELAQLCEIRIGDEAPVVHGSTRLPPAIVVALAELGARYRKDPILPTGGRSAPGRRSVLVQAMTSGCRAPRAISRGSRTRRAWC